MQRALWGITLLAATIGSMGNAHGNVILDFTDIPIQNPPDTDSDPIFAPYMSQGFTLNFLAGFNPALSAGYQAHGTNSIFWMGKVGVSEFAPGSPPDNIIALTKDDGTAFSLVSIDLARLFPFDEPAPTVSFTGTLAGGGTVVESFTVTTSNGLRDFQTFAFTGFQDVMSVTWRQPVASDGLHQFTDINIATSVNVPEPSTFVIWSLVTGMFGVVWSYKRLKQTTMAA